MTDLAAEGDRCKICGKPIRNVGGHWYHDQPHDPFTPPIHAPKPVSDLADEIDRLYALSTQHGFDPYEFTLFMWEQAPAIAAALRERDVWRESCLHNEASLLACQTAYDHERVRAETAEAEHHELLALLTEVGLRTAADIRLAAHAATVEGRP